MQFQLLFDYDAIVNSCSFTRKYDAIFQPERTIPTLSRTLSRTVFDKVRDKV